MNFIKIIMLISMLLSCTPKEEPKKVEHIEIVSIPKEEPKNLAPKNYFLRVSYYMGFSGAGPRMKNMQVMTIVDNTEMPVAGKIFIDETNELREIFYRNAEGEHKYLDVKKPDEHAEVEKLFEIAVPEKIIEKVHEAAPEKGPEIDDDKDLEAL